MRLQVLKFDNDQNFHVCKCVETGMTHRVDLFVDGGIFKELTEADLVGMVIEVDYLHPFIEIAHNVKIVGEKP